MRRLTKLLNRLDIFNDGIPDEFFHIVGTLNLSPGEPIPDAVPSKSWIFVEEGLLLLKQRDGDGWICGNMYNEGISTVFYNPDPTEPEQISFRVEAVEPSTVLYLSPDDETKVNEFYPMFSAYRRRLNYRSYRKSQKRSEIRSIPVKQRIAFVEKYYPFLFRVPIDELAELLQIKSKTLKMNLRSAQTKYHLRKAC